MKPYLARLAARASASVPTNASSPRTSTRDPADPFASVQAAQPPAPEAAAPAPHSPSAQAFDRPTPVVASALAPTAAPVSQALSNEATSSIGAVGPTGDGRLPVSTQRHEVQAADSHLTSPSQAKPRPGPTPQASPPPLQPEATPLQIADRFMQNIRVKSARAAAISEETFASKTSAPLPLAPGPGLRSEPGAPSPEDTSPSITIGNLSIEVVHPTAPVPASKAVSPKRGIRRSGSGIGRATWPRQRYGLRQI
jgi:hypothetical protein